MKPRFARFPGFKSVLLFAHFVRSCAGPDLNREDFASLVLWAANPFAHTCLSRSFEAVCAGPDLNRRTPTGQRPKRLGSKTASDAEIRAVLRSTPPA